MEKFLTLFITFQNSYINIMRIAIFVVMAWIGGLKAFTYEADGIVPFVINSPFMSFFYQNTGNTVINEQGKEVAEYTLYKNPEGKTVQKKYRVAHTKQYICFLLRLRPRYHNDWNPRSLRHLVSKNRFLGRSFNDRNVLDYTLLSTHNSRSLCP